MTRLRVGVQLHPQDGSVEELRAAWRAADELGVNSIWLWDHFFPLYGPGDAPHWECYTLLTAMALDTDRASVGALVTCNSYRNPNLLADMARTIDHLSGGRFVLGIGSGWFERDYAEYGYEFGTAGSRLADLASALPVIRDRFRKLVPPPVGPMPVLIGGSGRNKTLRLVAEHADAWNTFGPPENWSRLNRILDEHCAVVGRDPAAIERTVAIEGTDVDNAAAYAEAGAQHLIVMVPHPYDLSPVEQLL